MGRGKRLPKNGDARNAVRSIRTIGKWASGRGETGAAVDLRRRARAEHPAQPGGSAGNRRAHRLEGRQAEQPEDLVPTARRKALKQ